MLSPNKKNLIWLGLDDPADTFKNESPRVPQAANNIVAKIGINFIKSVAGHLGLELLSGQAQ